MPSRMRSTKRSSTERCSLPLAAASPKRLRLVAEQRGGGERDAERRVDLVRDAGDELAERGELLRLDQVGLRLLQLGERRVGAVLGFAQRLLAAADLGDEDVGGARHVAELVAAVEVGDRPGARHSPQAPTMRCCSSRSGRVIERATARPVSEPSSRPIAAPKIRMLRTSAPIRSALRVSVSFR